MTALSSLAGRRAQLHQHLRATFAADAKPSALAAAVALGVFLGCSPLYGFQTLLVLVLSTALRLNPVAAILGSQVSLPPLGFAIVGAEVAFGEWFRYGQWVLPGAGMSAPERLHWLWGHALLSWALGSAVIGGALALAGGATTYGILRVLGSARRKAKTLGTQGLAAAPESSDPPSAG